MSNQLELFTGGQDMEVIDLSTSLPRHPSGKTYKKRKLHQFNRIVIHTTDRDWTIDKLAKYDITPYFMYKGKRVYNHIDPTGLPAITYHDVIKSNGKIFHTLPYEDISMHAGGYNTGSIAVALMYVVTNPKYPGESEFAPSSLILKSLQCHLGKICLKFNLTPDRIFGHRELKGTGWFLSKNGSKRLRKTCPGRHVDLDELRKNSAIYMQLVLKTKDFYTGQIDGDFGKKSRAALVLYQNQI